MTLNSFKCSVLFLAPLYPSRHMLMLFVNCKKISRLTGCSPVLSPYALQCPLASDVVLQTDSSFFFFFFFFTIKICNELHSFDCKMIENLSIYEHVCLQFPTQDPNQQVVSRNTNFWNIEHTLNIPWSATPLRCWWRSRVARVWAGFLAHYKPMCVAKLILKLKSVGAETALSGTVCSNRPPLCCWRSVFLCPD